MFFKSRRPRHPGCSSWASRLRPTPPSHTYHYPWLQNIQHRVDKLQTTHPCPLFFFMISKALPNFLYIGESILSVFFLLTRSAPSSVIHTCTFPHPLSATVWAMRRPNMALFGSLPPCVITITYFPFLSSCAKDCPPIIELRPAIPNPAPSTLRKSRLFVPSPSSMILFPSFSFTCVPPFENRLFCFNLKIKKDNSLYVKSEFSIIISLNIKISYKAFRVLILEEKQ